MAVPQTKAASYIQEHTEEISSHQIISLLMDGAIERVGQAIYAFHHNQTNDLELLTQKLVAIINGLRNSLDLESGGDIAQNLDSLYEYMVANITQCEFDKLPDALTETRRLLAEIKSGWDNMELKNMDLTTL